MFCFVPVCVCVMDNNKWFRAQLAFANGPPVHLVVSLSLSLLCALSILYIYAAHERRCPIYPSVHHVGYSFALQAPLLFIHSVLHLHFLIHTRLM